MNAITKHIHIEQVGRGVIVWVFRRKGGEFPSCRAYRAQPPSRNPGFIARRVKRGIRLLNASMEREWVQD